MNIYGKRWISTFKESGVTEEEYCRFLGAQLTSLAEYIGWNHELQFEGDWINSSGSDYCPMLSPDGKFFFYTRTDAGTGDIYWVDVRSYRN